MSRIFTFTNPNSETLVMDGSQYLVTNVDGVDATTPSPMTQTSPLQDGETFIASVYPPKLSTIEGIILDRTGLAGINTKRRVIVSALNPSLGLGTLKLTWQGVDYVCNYLPQQVTFPSKNSQKRYQEFQIQILKPYPFWRSNLVETITLGTVTKLLRFPTKFPTFFSTTAAIGYHTATITGDIPSPCIVTIPGPVINPVITNVLTGEKLQFSISLDFSQSLVINTAYDQSSVRLMTLSGNTNAIGYMSLDSRFFQLIPGANVINFTDDFGSNHGNPTIQWYQWYLGV